MLYVSSSAGTTPRRLRANTTHYPSVFTRLAAMPHGLSAHPDRPRGTTRTPTFSTAPEPLKTRLERHSTNQRRTVGNRQHPSPTTHHIRGPPEPKLQHTTVQPSQATRPKPAPSTQPSHTQAINTSQPHTVEVAPARSSMIGAAPVALVRLLGFLGQLDGISLKIENIGHGCHLLPHTSLITHRGMLNNATSFNTQLERHSSNQRRTVGDWQHPSPTTRHIRGPPEPKLQRTTVQPSQATRPTGPINSALTHTAMN